MSIQCPTFTRVLRLRLKDKHARALREHAYWVNQVWNYCNDLSFKVLKREHRFLSGFDLQKYTAGATREGLPLHSQTVQAIAEEYALRRKQFKKTKLRWRVSNPLHVWRAFWTEGPGRATGAGMDLSLLWGGA